MVQPEQPDAASTLSCVWGASPQELDVQHGVRHYGHLTEDPEGNPQVLGAPTGEDAGGVAGRAPPLSAVASRGRGVVAEARETDLGERGGYELCIILKLLSCPES